MNPKEECLEGNTISARIGWRFFSPAGGHDHPQNRFPPGPGTRPGNRGLSIASKSFCIMKQGLQTVPRNNRKAYPPFNAIVPHTISDHGSRRPLRADAGTGGLEGGVV
jgi:hypothetical protein